MVYIIGSLRNPQVPTITRKLRYEGIPVFSDWFGAGERADDSWQAYEQSQGFSYIEALKRPAAQNVFNFDKRHLEAASAAVLLAPAGKSGHLELGWILGQGKPGYILLDKEPERWDVMLNFSTAVFLKFEDLLAVLKGAK